MEKPINVAEPEGKIQQQMKTKQPPMTRHLRLYLKRIKSRGIIPNTLVAPTPSLASNDTHKKKQQSTVEINGKQLQKKDE